MKLYGEQSFKTESKIREYLGNEEQILRMEKRMEKRQGLEMKKVCCNFLPDALQ